MAHVFLLTDLLDHEFEALSRFINLGNTIAHNVKPEALGQFNIEACVSEGTYLYLQNGSHSLLCG
jgi:hypothetical protein